MRNHRRKNWIAALVLAAGIVLTACSDSGDGEVLAGSDTVQTESVGIQELQGGNYEAAVETLTSEAEGQSGRTLEETLRQLGIAYMGLGDYENAVSAFEESLTDAGVIPSDVEYDINYYLGSCYYKLGRYQDALEVYDAIVTLRPKAADAYVLRGAVRIALGDESGMNEDYQRAIDLEPTNYDQIATIYEMLDRSGYTEQGQAYLTSTLETYGGSMDNYNLGRINYYLGNYNEAKSALEQIETRDYSTAILLGQTYEALGDMNFASSVYQTYLASDSSHPEVYNQLGLCLLAMKDYDGALEAFQEGESIGDSESYQSLMFNEIVAYEHLGEFSKAQARMKEYLARYPGDEDARREDIFLSTR